MKKSCSGIKSKLVRNGNNDIALNESEVGRGLAVDEQIDVNKTNAESTIDDENIGRLEKKSANNSISTSFKEKFHRTSPRLGKINSAKAAKWVENSFETKKNENVSQTRTPKNDSEFSKNQVKTGNSVISTKDASQEFQVISTPSSAKNKKEVANNEHNQGLKDNCISPKSSRTVQCLKVHVEEKSKDQTSACTPCCKVQSPNNRLGKKRSSFTQKNIDSAKKIKMEETTNNNNNNNNEHSDIYNGNNDNSNNNNNDDVDKMTLDSENMLKIELELEKRRKNATFNIRDIKTIVAESEFRNKKWKETFLKYKCPARWGIPIVKNSSEKWDGKQIPQKLLNRYQKYLLSNNLNHPIFFPENSEYKHEESFNENELADSQKQTSSSGSGIRMTLRNRNQQKPPVIEDDFLKSLDEEFLDEDSDDWMTKHKPGKKHRNNLKNKKNLMLNNQQLVLKLERCTINKKYAKSESNMNEDDVQENYSLNVEDHNQKAECQVDTMVCPICSLRFPKQQIESHATECASKTFKD